MRAPNHLKHCLDGKRNNVMRIRYILKSSSVLFLFLLLSDLPEASICIREVRIVAGNAKSLYSALDNWHRILSLEVMKSRIYPRKDLLNSCHSVHSHTSLKS